MPVGMTDAELRFRASLQDDVSPKVDQLEKKLKQMGASPAEIKMFLRAYDEASAKVQDVQKNLDKMPKEQIVNIKASVDDAASKLGGLRKEAEAPMKLNFVDNIEEIGSKLFNLRTKVNLPIGGVLGGAGMGQLYGMGIAGAGAGALGAGAISLIQQGVQYNSQMEQSMVTLTQTLKDQAQARQEMGQLVSFAQKTPFAYGDVLAADVRLRSYQIPTMPGEGGPNNQGWLKSAGDMAAAMGTPITQAVEAIADARQGYFVRMMSYGIRMMREDFQAGGKYAGLSYEQGLERAIRRFEGAMEMQSKTFQGTMSNLKDIFQQQVLGPVGYLPFQAVKGVAQQAYSALSDPKQLEKLGLVMQDIQHRQVEFFATVKEGRALFEVHLKEPLEEILSNVMQIGQVFGQAFGGTTGAVLKTVGAALLSVAGIVTNIAAKLPGFTQFYGMLKALSFLGFNNISDPFLNLFKSINPLTFSLKGILSSMFQMPGAIAKLGIALVVKHFIDAHQASKAFESQFKNMSELSLGKLNLQVEGLAMRLGKSAAEMKNLSTYAGGLMEDAGLKGSGGGQRGAQNALNAAEQATLLQQNFGWDPQRAISMMVDTFEARNTTVNQAAENRFFDVLKQATIGIQELGGSATDLATIFSEFSPSAAKIGITGPGFTDDVYAIQKALTNRMTTAQINQFRSPDAMIQEMFSAMAQPSVEMISQLTGRGSRMGALSRYFSFKGLDKLPTKANNMGDADYAAVQAYMRGNMPRGQYMRFLSGGLETTPGFLNRAKKGPDRISGALDLQYGFDLMNSTYLANERAKRQSAAAIAKVAPSVDLSKIQPQNPYLENKMGVDFSKIRGADTAQQQVTMIGQAWLQASKNLDGLNSKIEAWQENITATTGKQINFQNAMDLVNAQMSKFQFQITQANRLVEDASLAMQSYQLNTVMPLQNHMNILNNEITKVGHGLQVAQHELGKYSEGLIKGEQASLNQLHSLERYNKQLQLLQLSYQQMGAELGRNHYERGFSSRVEPIAGLSLQMQMDRLQRRQQIKQLEYDLNYGEKHYQLQQAGRTKYQRQEMDYQERLKGVRENTQASDKYTEAQYRLQNQQYALGQQMFKVNQEVFRQQQGLMGLQLNVQRMQQSPAFRALQDEQMQLQMHLDATNRKLNLQNQNLTQWQNLMDDLKDQKQNLGDTFATLTGAAGLNDTEKIRSMIDLWAELPRSMGGITDAQKKAIEQLLTKSYDAQKAQRDKSLSDYESWWDKVRNITTQGFIGLFTGQTWSMLGQVIHNAVANLFAQLGLPGGDMLGGGIGNAITLGGTAYAMFTGGRFVANMARRTALTGAAAVAGRFLPETHMANRLAGGMNYVGTMLGDNSIGRWFTQQGTGSSLVGESGDIAKWIKSLRPGFMEAFQLIKSLRAAIAGAGAAALGSMVGGPLGGIGAGLVGARWGSVTPFREWPVLGKALSSFGPVKAGLDVIPEINFTSRVGRFFGGIGGFITKALEFSGLGALAKGGLRIAGKAAAISIPIFAALDLKTAITGSGEDKRRAMFSLGATGAGAAIGGALGLMGGPFAPLTVPAGMMAGAATGQLVGPLLAKANWSKVADAIVEGVKSIPRLALEGIKLAFFKGPAFLLGLHMAIFVKLPFQIARKAVTEGWSLARRAFSMATDWLGSAIANIWNFFTADTAAGARKAASRIPSVIENALEWMTSKLPTIIWRAIKSIGQMFVDAIGSLPGDVAGAFQSGLDMIPGFQTGIERVDQQMLARLHPNEAVLNSAEAGMWRQQKAAGSRAGTGFQIGIGQSDSIKSTFGDIELDWRNHLDKVRDMVKEHERVITDVNDIANAKIVGTNKRGQAEIGDTIKAHNQAIEKRTRRHYGNVREDTEDGLKHTKKTVHHQLKDVNDMFRHTGDVIKSNFKVPKLDVPKMPKQGPLSAITGAIGSAAQMKQQHKQMMKALRGMSDEELSRLVIKYGKLPEKYHTPQADAISAAAIEIQKARSLRQMFKENAPGDEEETQRKRRQKYKDNMDWYLAQDSDYHQKSRQVRKDAEQRFDREQDSRNKNLQNKQAGALDLINAIFGTKLRTSNDIYNRGWKAIFGTTSNWIGSIQKIVKGIDEDLGLTKEHGGGKGGGASDADAKHHPAYAHGGLVTGADIPKGKLIRVAEEGHDEVVIPLAPHRRQRAQSLIKQVQGRIGGHANGGFIRERIPGTDTAYLAAKAAYNVAAFANGGYAQGAQPPSGPGSEGIRYLAAQMAKKGFWVTSGGEYRGSGTYHDQQKALDFGDSVNSMERLWSYLYPVRSQTLELFGPSRLGPATLFDNGQAFSDAALQADHEDHIHIAVDHIIKALGLVKGMKGFPGGIGGMGMLAKPLPKVPESLKKMGPMGKKIYQTLAKKLKKWKGAGGKAAGSITLGQLGETFAAINRIYGEHNSGEGDWGGPTLPFNVVAALAEAAGMPGVTFAQIAKGESGLRPGATGIDPGGTKGLGLWMITTGYNDALIRKYGGWRNMLNPVINAKAAKEIYDSQGIGAWYGTGFMTGTNLHYKGKIPKLAGGMPRIPYDNFPALLHKDEKVVSAGDAQRERSGKKDRDVSKTAMKWDETLREIQAILEQIRKAKEHLKDIKDIDERREARERLQALRNELASRRRLATAQAGQFKFGIKRLLHRAGDKSGGEQTARLVARERRRYKKMMKKAIAKAKKSKAYRKAVRRIGKDRARIKKLKRGGVTGKERRRIKSLRKDIKKQQAKKAKIIKKAKQKARAAYLKSAAKRGINAALIKAITGKALTKKERQKYIKRAKQAGYKVPKGKGAKDKAKAGKDTSKHRKNVEKLLGTIHKGAEKRFKQTKTEKAKSDKARKALDDKREKAQKAADKARKAQEQKEKALAHKDRMRRDGERAKDKANAAKRRAQREQRQSKRQAHLDNRANKAISRTQNFQEKSLNLLQSIARKDLNVNIHNESNGSYINTSQSGGGGGGARRRK